MFQSTLPCEGATPEGPSRQDGFFVSIHAPVRGSDHGRISGEASQRRFNPRSRARERHAKG